MSFNPNYKAIAKDFVEQYYAMFDNRESRANVVNFYSPTESFMTFEGHQIQGTSNILEKVQSLNFQKINREITTVDSPILPKYSAEEIIYSICTHNTQYQIQKLSG